MAHFARASVGATPIWLALGQGGVTATLAARDVGERCQWCGGLLGKVRPMRTDLLASWLKGVRLSHIAHTQAASNDSRRHKAFGIPVVIATTIVGTAVFANLGEVSNPRVAVAAGLLSLAAAVLSSLQTFLGYATSAERHRTVALKYGVLRRELEQFLEDPPESKAEWTKFVEDFRKRWNAVDQEAPEIPQGTYRKAAAQLEKSLAQ